LVDFLITSSFDASSWKLLLKVAWNRAAFYLVQKTSVIKKLVQ